jgi:hypothetical protein
MLGLRTATRASQALPAFRNTAARRWASSGAEFKGAADNAFNRERAAVKQHAADTSGKWRVEGGRRERVVLVGWLEECCIVGGRRHWDSDRRERRGGMQEEGIQEDRGLEE